MIQGLHSMTLFVTSKSNFVEMDMCASFRETRSSRMLYSFFIGEYSRQGDHNFPLVVLLQSLLRILTQHFLILSFEVGIFSRV